jgi:hypothetical protein
MSDSPNVLLLMMHRYVDGDSEKVAEALYEEIANHCHDLIKDYFIGLAFGKYDIILEYEPVSLRKSYTFIDHVREWIWETRLTGVQLQGCISSMESYKIMGQYTKKKSELSPAINTYSLFRLASKNQEELAALFDYFSKNKDLDVETDIFWNASAMSYMLKASGNDFGNIFTFLYNLRENNFLRDLCTFVTLKWDANDKSCRINGLRAMINVKINEKGLATELLRRFDDMKARLGYFDLVREIDCTNLSMALAAIKETRVALFEGKRKDLPNRTATILGLGKVFFQSTEMVGG